jgi:nucleoside-diphosphate-sugar epimerase
VDVCPLCMHVFLASRLEVVLKLQPAQPWKVVVTGANGFIGLALCRALATAGRAVTGAVRAANRQRSDARHEHAVVGDIDNATNWLRYLQGADAVVHLAARTQNMGLNGAAFLRAMRRVNVEGSENLARQAAASGVKRLVYVSSIKVNGDRTGARPFMIDDQPSPQDAYAISKFEAEQALWRVASETSLEIVLVRPPLVYGPRVKGNFLRLMQWTDKCLPLPLADLKNRRSMIALDNLTDFLMLCTHHPAAAGQIFLINDGLDLSTPELMRRIARALGRSARLWPMPVTLLRLAAHATCMQAEFDRLGVSLQVDASYARKRLAWRPRISVDEALSHTAKWYHAQKHC